MKPAYMWSFSACSVLSQLLCIYCHLHYSPDDEQQLASDRYTNHKDGWVMDGVSDRLRRLVGRLCLRSLTLSIFWSTQPPSHCFHLTPRSTPVTPTSCLWPLIIALPLRAMCWESKGSHLLLIRMKPHHLWPHALNHNQSLGRQRWIGMSTTLYLSGEAPAFQRDAVTDK